MTKEYKLHLKELLKLVKSKGVLVETIQLQIGDSFSLYEPRENYKKSLGAVAIKTFFKKNVKGVIDVYEDFDGSIKYYIFKEPTQKIRGNMIKRLEGK